MTMRMIQIPGLEYEQYGKIIDAIDGTIPFAIIEARYNPRTKTAFIYFWDGDYKRGCEDCVHDLALRLEEMWLDDDRYHTIVVNPSQTWLRFAKRMMEEFQIINR